MFCSISQNNFFLLIVILAVFVFSSVCIKEPVLFSGTMRRNIDPFNDHPDMELWNVLDEVTDLPFSICYRLLLFIHSS